MNISAPRRLTREQAPKFIHDCCAKMYQAGPKTIGTIYIDVSSLTFIDPTGVASLYNFISIAQHNDISVKLIGSNLTIEVHKYLDDSGFFKHYNGRRLDERSNARSTTVPFVVVHEDAYYTHLNNVLMPWIAAEIYQSTNDLDVLRITLEEAYHNIWYHSNVKVGCVFAQHYPKKGVIEVILSDHGIGIPKLVSTKVEGLADHTAIIKAMEKGFTTGSNVRNRGWGLWQLANFTTQKNGGKIEIRSARGVVVAERGDSEPKINGYISPHVYPGTLVRVVLQTDTLHALSNDVEQEDFSW